MEADELKRAVREHWSREPCGTRGIAPAERKRFFDEIERERYEWEPYIPGFARFEEGRGKRVLEVGVGAGTDFINWVRNGADATGVDLTEQGVALVNERLVLEDLRAEVVVADAENLPFADATFDIVYSYGVLHHSPNTPKAIDEVYRVLKPGGRARIMIYHLRSVTGVTLWGLHCAAKLRPWKSPRWAIFNHLESPGTKAYTTEEARRLFSAYRRVDIRTVLGPGDLLLMPPSAKYQTWYFQVPWKLYPRRVIRRLGDRFGLGMLIEAER
jgi:SAM-dependent methyltransferase